MTYKLIKEHARGGREIVYQAESIEELARYCNQKSGAQASDVPLFDLGSPLGEDYEF